MDKIIGGLGGILFSGYAAWWGYVLVARPDIAEKWRKTRPQWVQRLMLVKKLPRFIEGLAGIVMLIFSLIFFLASCALLIQGLAQVAGR